MKLIKLLFLYFLYFLGTSLITFVIPNNPEWLLIMGACGLVLITISGILIGAWLGELASKDNKELKNDE